MLPYRQLSQLPLATPSSTAHISWANPPVVSGPEGIPEQFSRLMSRGDYLAAWDGGAHDRLDVAYQRDWMPAFSGRDHFQGAVRLRTADPYVVVSGGVPQDLAKTSDQPCSHLFFLRMQSRLKAAWWTSNLLESKVPSANDRVELIVRIDGYFWHPGGMGTSGDVLVVPLENSEQTDSRIVLLNVADPANPERFPPSTEILRPHAKCGAADITRAPDGRFVVAAWSDSEPSDRPHLDLYRSRSTNLFSGFDPIGVHAIDAVTGFEKYQAINFLWTDHDELYLVGFHDDAWPGSPGPNGKSWAELYAVELEDFDAPGYPTHVSKSTFRRIAKRRCECPDRQCNMDAASSVYVADDGRLAIYSAYHFRLVQDQQLRPDTSTSLLQFSEFRPTPYLFRPPINTQGEAWIDLFEHRDFGGRRLSLSGPTLKSYEDLELVWVQKRDQGFAGKISSLRYQISPDLTVALCEHANGGGNKWSLNADGRVHEVTNLAHHPIPFDDDVHSIQLK